jgi:hypothetical protein
MARVAVAGVTAAVSCGLLAVAVWRGWLGPDVGRGANFCEAAPQLANTLSNLGFVVSGLAIAAHRDGLAAHRHLSTAFACLVVLLGPGSAAMHATQSTAGGRLDTLSMYLVAAFALSYAIMRWLRGGLRLLVGAFVAVVAGCELIEAWDVEVPVLLRPGNAAFAGALVAAAVVEVLIARRGETVARRGFAVAALAAILAGFAVWNVGWCDPRSLVQGHAIWHVLSAVSAYLLFRYYASERGTTR